MIKYMNFFTQKTIILEDGTKIVYKNELSPLGFLNIYPFVEKINAASPSQDSSGQNQNQNRPRFKNQKKTDFTMGATRSKTLIQKHQKKGENPAPISDIPENPEENQEKEVSTIDGWDMNQIMEMLPFFSALFEDLVIQPKFTKEEWLKNVPFRVYYEMIQKMNITEILDTFLSVAGDHTSHFLD